jgi:L-seryl-tRNA(Ser) seleniumtransferase
MADFRIIPSIEHLRLRAGVRALEDDFGRAAIVEALREAAAALRGALAAPPGGAEGPARAERPATVEAAGAFIEHLARQLLSEAAQPSLRRVINATGVVVHTNLGRAPLPEAALARVQEVARSYSNLEFDLESGDRGHRDSHAEALLKRLLDVEAAVVVNNNAAAALLMLAALASGREVVVSRGELVEIGGGFRIPDVMAQSGARLREVGTTNRTRVSDYRQAVGPDTALLLRVHRSNFRIEGFTEQPALEELAGLGRELGLPVAEDIGSGCLGLPGEEADDEVNRLLKGEPLVQASLRAGMDLVCFSGDKLLGGPQAGIVAGRGDLVASIRRHPLMRALRVDKLTYAALEGTLAEYVSGRASRAIPILRMILATPAALEARCQRVIGHIDAGSVLHAEIRESSSAVGGGTTPGLELPSRVVALRHAHRGPDWLDDRLRRGNPPIVGRIEDDRLLLDLRTVRESEDAEVAEALRRIGE